MTESTRLIIVLVVMLLAIVFAGPWVVREVNERDKTYGGFIPQLMTWVAALALAGLVPGILMGLILGVVHRVAPIAFGALAIILISLIIYTATEFSAHQQHALKNQQDDGEDLWTAEKARTSGL